MVDLIRSGKAPDVVRRKGAEGSLPLPVEDKIEILALLTTAPEPDLRQKAFETLRGLESVEIRRAMANPKTAPDVLHFAAEHLLAEREELREILLWNPSFPAASRELLKPKPAPKPEAIAPPLPLHVALSPSPQPPSKPESTVERAADQATIEILAKLAAGEKIEDVAGVKAETPAEATKHDDQLTDKDRQTLIQKLNAMSVVEKIKAALTGNLETRTILIRDSNKMITRAVLQSPKISDSEAENYAAAKNVNEEVLRLIAANRKFMKTYVVMRALVNNPRAPIDITMPLLNRLNDRDLKGVSLNRNVPEVIRTLAIKAIKQKEEAAKPKLPGKH
jgi:hypothetical protein